MSRRRLDTELVRRGLVRSPGEAQEAVRAGRVTVAGRPASKVSTMVGTQESLRVGPSDRAPYVSRGGGKLRAALDRFAVDPRGCRCLDAGASTGGFTDCLLQAGAAAVIAVDVGYGQLAWELRDDERVHVLERTNVRTLSPDDLPFTPDLVVADLSFISLRSVAVPLVRLGGPNATFIALVKPQFEAGPADVPRGGVIRDAEVWGRTIAAAAAAFTEAGAGVLAAIASPTPGPAGNVEFLLHAKRGAAAVIDDTAIGAAIDEGRALRP